MTVTGSETGAMREARARDYHRELDDGSDFDLASEEYRECVRQAADRLYAKWTAATPPSPAPRDQTAGLGELSEAPRSRWLDWRGAVEGYDDSLAVAKKAVRQCNIITDERDIETIARNVLWMVGVDHIWHHVEAVRAALAEKQAPSVVKALRAEADRLHAKADALVAPTPVAPSPRNGAGTGWRPIKSAPRDGTAILAAWTPMVADNFCSVARCINGEWSNADNDEDTFTAPTHWMPLPAAPSSLPAPQDQERRS